MVFSKRALSLASTSPSPPAGSSTWSLPCPKEDGDDPFGAKGLLVVLLLCPPPEDERGYA
jgi:hypothetical protein